jgi:hypothetical protein
MADHDVEGDFDIVLRTLRSGEWSDLWNELNYDVESFMSLGISDDTSDVDLWRLCQERMAAVSGTTDHSDNGQSKQGRANFTPIRD